MVWVSMPHKKIVEAVDPVSVHLYKSIYPSVQMISNEKKGYQL
jgi:hypothetical protein